MPAFTYYLVSMAVVFIVWGAIWYNLDRAYGVAIRRWWYNLTHEHPLPPGEGRGFIYERDTRTKFTWATILSTIQSALVVIYSGSVDLLMELPAWLIEVPLMVVGMYLGRPLGNLWGGRDRVFDKLDEWERELGDDEQPKPDAADKPKAAAEPRAAEPEPTPEPEPELDPQELMERFTKKRGG
jgi:hypothetical protein